jgi:hypothetical protein
VLAQANLSVSFRGAFLALKAEIVMSPVHREPPKQKDDARSFWTTTWIFVTLVVLTALMTFFAKELVSGRPGRPDAVIDAAK